MKFEEFKPGKSVGQIIDEAIESLSRQLYDEEERNEVTASLLGARVLTQSGSRERAKIDELLQDIETRYGKN